MTTPSPTAVPTGPGATGRSPSRAHGPNDFETEALARFAAHVREGLTAEPKWLSSMYLYDEVGSRLFEAICSLPEYYLTRAEQEILEHHSATIAGRMPSGTRIVEFGAGSAVKTRLLLAAFEGRQEDTVFCPIDISEEAMRFAEANVRAEFPDIHFKGIIASYDEGLRRVAAMSRDPKLVLFLGSSIGNFVLDDAVAFLSKVRESMGPEDRLLLGTDLVKDSKVLRSAYDDAAGVTAAFDRNVLVRVNHTFGANFDAQAFAHEARWNETLERIEMHLVATSDQVVRVEALDLDLMVRAGESIHTENSYKYTPARLRLMMERSGLYLEESWTDEGTRFGLHLIRPRRPDDPAGEGLDVAPAVAKAQTETGRT